MRVCNVATSGCDIWTVMYPFIHAQHTLHSDSTNKYHVFSGAISSKQVTECDGTTTMDTQSRKLWQQSGK